MSEDLATIAGRAIHLATHPAFELTDCQLHCPCCGWKTEDPVVFTDHFLNHQPASVLAVQWLPAVDYLVHAEEQGWDLLEAFSELRKAK